MLMLLYIAESQVRRKIVPKELRCASQKRQENKKIKLKDRNYKQNKEMKPLRKTCGKSSCRK